MTKKEILETIRENELQAWKDLKQCEKIFGEQHKWTIRRLAVWSAYYELIEKFKLTQLPR